MKLIKTLAFCAISTSFMFGSSSLVTKAEKNGLKPIPESKLELLKIIDDKNDPITKEKVELGKKLYFDPRLSKSGIISCNTCHNLGLGGSDGVSAAIGHKWTMNPHHLNSPTVYNSVFFDVQFWDGRSKHLADQAQGPVQAGPEMASPKSLVEKRINSIPDYVNEFKKAYTDDVKISFEKITSTIAIFEKTLVTPSRFDSFLNGKENALTKEEKKGLNTFIDKGCASCHNGIALGGTMQPFQVAAKYSFAKVGDFKGDKNSMVKTPTLRNITETAPYFHNGQIWSLSKAVKEMGSTQLGIKISDKEANEIVTFLKSLKGDKPQIVYPQLPESTINTPQPQYN
ncbi:cytochrome C biogenesis protein CcsA [Malaciobacter molluscorum LMG 25693]|uniref:Cytochrome C biogenesis protein CcsA n=1 Tax=Malaciobacter molluscorum LMG 25693 TaxID=870501 RepID=A0A2G1DIL7_9BACT|nr:cytochrome-c peroxidase [Malaciobacter molluscorum]AXX91938.1 periplasmic diheme cytochrome c peroxidase [Malaciobacter molluscorum LMG 25693]PHO18342.1 cytochrome C biogenesis protein CcsA [Malaciobacter molluscorum LMG 25693]